MRTQRKEREREKKNETNSNANTVELKQDLNICLADGRQPTTADREKCAYTGWILLQSIHIQKRTT